MITITAARRDEPISPPFSFQRGRHTVSEQRQQLCGSLLRIHLGDHICDHMVGIGDEGGADGAHVFASGHFLFLPHAERLIDLGRGIAQKQERK